VPDQAFEDYGLWIGEERYPVVFMSYASVNVGLNYYEDLRDRLEQIEIDTGFHVIPQIGFYIPPAGMPRGQYDTQLQRMVDGIALLGRPVFLRIGYEFNGVWYDPLYEPRTFIRSFRRVAQTIRAAGVEAVTVWNPYPAYNSFYGSWDYIRDFYPGDAYVDWFGIDVFAAYEMTSPETAKLIADAHAREKPILIGEATPRFIGADDASDWDSWFGPFFEMIQNNPGIKGHAYINWDWGLTNRWPDWGNADLIAAHPDVQQRYRSEFDDPIWIHAKSARQSWMFFPNPGDMNCDGTVDFFDIDPFVNVLVDPGQYATDYPNCDAMRADIDEDGSVTFFDIDPFVALLLQ
jgi:hypothetical protein